MEGNVSSLARINFNKARLQDSEIMCSIRTKTGLNSLFKHLFVPLFHLLISTTSCLAIKLQEFFKKCQTELPRVQPKCFSHSYVTQRKIKAANPQV